MIGILFHGPGAFDSGWARRLIEELGPGRRMLAGTMARTALIDSGLSDVECPGRTPSECLRELARTCETVVLVTHGKSVESGLLFGRMVVDRAAVTIPVVQVECGAPCRVQLQGTETPCLTEAFNALGCRVREDVATPEGTWEADGLLHRRMTSAAPGDFLLVDGFVVGRATGEEVVFSADGRRIVAIRGAEIKAHGLEKLERLGGVDLRCAKLASTHALRKGELPPRVRIRKGHGVVFIDHAGMHVYDLIDGVEGAVSVGDDTTSIVGDVLYRFGLPLIGIVDGDGDAVLGLPRLAPGSSVLTVRSDDTTGLRVFSELFHDRPRTDASFAAIRDAVARLIGKDLISRRDI